MKQLIALASSKGQKVQVVTVEGLTGYEFDAVGPESLPLAVELALLQTQRPWEIKDLVNAAIDSKSERARRII